MRTDEDIFKETWLSCRDVSKPATHGEGFYELLSIGSVREEKVVEVQSCQISRR